MRTFRRRQINKLVGVKLSVTERNFLAEYTTDYNQTRAAEAVGMEPASGSQILSRENVREAVRIIYNHQMQSHDITAETVKEEMLDLYYLAIQEGKLSVASKQLDQLARHSHVDAYAAQRVAVQADAEVAKALQEGRRRIQKLKSQQEGTQEGTQALPPVDFS